MYKMEVLLIIKHFLEKKKSLTLINPSCAELSIL